MTEPAPAQTTPRLYHAPSSYYSAIARLALAEGGVGYVPVFMDIHVRAAQQRPDYVRLNPHMTVPALVLPDRVLGESRAIAEYALGVDEATLAPETRAWLDLHYGFPIEELTFGGLLARNPVVRRLFPRMLRRAHRRLLARAAENPDLADAYRARAEVFAARIRTFDPDEAAPLYARRRDEAIGIMQRLDARLADGRPALTGAYGIADAVFTVFLARMVFVGLGAEIARRPALARYWGAMQTRPSFAAADVWTRPHVGRLIWGILPVRESPAIVR